MLFRWGEFMSAENSFGDKLLTTFYKIGGTIRPVLYTIVDNLAVAEGCIILGTPKEAVASLEAVQRNPGLLRSGVSTLGSAILGENYRWPGGRVPFEIAPNLPNPDRVTNAIAHWEAHTNIRFSPKTGADQDFVTFITGSGCKSAVGRRGGQQFVTLEATECSTGNTIHEIGHALGLWHEQSRLDRDAYIDILWENILSGTESNFLQRLHDSKDVGRYDYGSIMHYKVDAFSKNGQPTIRVVGHPGTVIGQRDGLSAGDIATIAAIYS